MAKTGSLYSVRTVGVPVLSLGNDRFKSKIEVQLNRQIISNNVVLIESLRIIMNHEESIE